MGAELGQYTAEAQNTLIFPWMIWAHAPFSSALVCFFRQLCQFSDKLPVFRNFRRA